MVRDAGRGSASSLSRWRERVRVRVVQHASERFQASPNPTLTRRCASASPASGRGGKAGLPDSRICQPRQRARSPGLICYPSRRSAHKSPLSRWRERVRVRVVQHASERFQASPNPTLTRRCASASPAGGRGEKSSRPQSRIPAVLTHSVWRLPAELLMRARPVRARRSDPAPTGKGTRSARSTRAAWAIDRSASSTG